MWSSDFILILLGEGQGESYFLRGGLLMAEEGVCFVLDVLHVGTDCS